MRMMLVALALAVAAIGAPASAASAAAAPRHSAPAPPRRADEGDTCRRLPAGTRLKLSLKPNTDLADLVSWISAITCKPFIIPGTIPPQSKTVMIVAPRTITAGEAYDLFLAALDSVGLTVYSSNGVLHVVETAKIKSEPIPVEIEDHG